jgi:hypothetical protein
VGTAIVGESAGHVRTPGEITKSPHAIIYRAR